MKKLKQRRRKPICLRMKLFLSGLFILIQCFERFNGTSVRKRKEKIIQLKSCYDSPKKKWETSK